MTAQTRVEMSATGIEEIEKALKGLTFRKRQNVERKASRAAMNKLKKSVQRGWRQMPVEEPSPKKYSIRKHAAKAQTVRVSGRGRGVTARVHMNYHKKNAGRAKMAHLLEWSHKTGESGAGFSMGKHPTANVYRRTGGIVRDQYMKALMLWLMNPKLKQAQVRERI